MSLGLEGCAYEELDVSVAEYFLPIINQAYLSGDTVLYEYQSDGLIGILKEAEDALYGYLNGSRVQRKITPYQVGDLVAENGILYNVPITKSNLYF